MTIEVQCLAIKALRLPPELLALLYCFRRRAEAGRLIPFVVVVGMYLCGDIADILTGNVFLLNVLDSPLVVYCGIFYKLALFAALLHVIGSATPSRAWFRAPETWLAVGIVGPFIAEFAADLIRRPAISVGFFTSEFVLFALTLVAFTVGVATVSAAYHAGWTFFGAGFLVTMIGAWGRRYQIALGVPEQSIFYHAVWTLGLFFQCSAVWGFKDGVPPVRLFERGTATFAKVAVLCATYFSILALILYEKPSVFTMRLVTLWGLGGTFLTVFLSRMFARNEDAFIEAIRTASDSPAFPSNQRRTLRVVLEQNALLRVENEIAQARAAVCAQVSHDIRSPVAVIQTLLKGSGDLDTERRSLMAQAASRIGQIADDLLAAERRKNVEATPVVVAEHVGAIVSQKRLELDDLIRPCLEYDADVGALQVQAVLIPSNFYRMLSNLLNNALEAARCNEKLPRVAVTLKAENDWSIIAITDNGPGMAPEVLQNLGERGFTAGKSEGNGLGIFHARRQVEMWGGCLEFDSALGRGTTASIRLPRYQPPGKSLARHSRASGASI